MINNINNKSLSCPVCRGRSPKLVTEKNGWTYYRCRPCSLVFIHPQPSPEFLAAKYQEYLPDNEDRIRDWRLSMEEVIRKSAQLIEKERGPGRILDVGCGYGFFLDHMAGRGWQVEGVEISPLGRAYAARHFPALKLRETPLPDPDLPSNYYEAVTLFYVVEHLPDPIRVLKEARRILKPGGVLLLRWPHSTPIVRLLGPLGRGLDLYHTPYHLFDYSPRFMEKTLADLGFESIRTTIAGNTRPRDRLGRWSSMIFGGLGEFLSRVTGGRLLLPGVSKTTVARKIPSAFPSSPKNQR
ncbi:MAG: class I SAM-dependent methyltransferase [Deltaproteobacteria bacterium]|nr:class I SAM-dependent methyltransferase [Deltaproteobacteria bacterium]